MKTKFKKLIAVILSLCIIASLTACNDADNSQKWVLTYEKWTNTNEEILQERFYEYDKSSKLVGEKLDYGVDGTYTCSDFKYDSFGNVIEKKETYNDFITGEEQISYYTYKYDENGVLLEEIRDSSTEKATTRFIIRYTYDDKGNVIEEKIIDEYEDKISGSWSSSEEINTYVLEYENDLCVQCEGTIRNREGTSYILKRYEYDKSGNKIQEFYYNAFTEGDDESNIIAVNEKSYKLITIKYYTYEKLNEVATSTQTNNDSTNIFAESQIETPQNIDENTTSEEVETKLSDSCDKVMASGYDADNNYYELVANETEDYMGTKIEMGIIKNNEWSVQMTSTNTPFIANSGRLIALEESIYDGDTKFYYIGAGCFSDYGGWNLWNGNTGASFNESGYQFQINIMRNETIINNEGLFLLAPSTSEDVYKLFNANTMSVTAIKLTREYSDKAFPYSEGLFAVVQPYSATHEKNGFYNSSGEKVVDLSQYEIPNAYVAGGGIGYSGRDERLVFDNDKCTFKVENDQGSWFEITINKQGDVIESIRVD